jgi:peptide/nickel transport system ATP-binding protein
MNQPQPLLEVNDLYVDFDVREGIVRALKGIDFSLGRGQTLGIIGESGSGKSVTARAIMRLLAKNGSISNGEILFHRPTGGKDSASEEVIDLAKLDPDGRQVRDLRGGEIAMIFQEPMSSLTPVYTAGNHIMESVMLHLTGGHKIGAQMERNMQTKNPSIGKAEARERAIRMLDMVGIPQPSQRVDSYPHQLSGGQRQRVMIAVALSSNPSLLIADEPTTALDVTTQAQINDLMLDLQQEFGMAILYITHDLGVIAEMTKDVVVMYLGQIVERGTVDDIFYEPKHPYTRALLESIPKMGHKTGDRLETIKGMIPDVFSIPPGCPFHNRCPEFMPGVCDTIVPEPIQVNERQMASCLLYDQTVKKEVAHAG